MGTMKTTNTKARRVRARSYLTAAYGIKDLNGATFARYLQRMKSAEFDEENRVWTCLDNEPDPRRPNTGRPRVNPRSKE